MKRLLDTNAYSEFKRGHEAVAGLVRGASRVLLSAVVLGELLYGFRRGSRYERNRDELRRFLANPYVELIPVGEATADRFARVAEALREKGRPIPTNDIWIAAHALETGAELVSFDQHFVEVDGVVWIQP